MDFILSHLFLQCFTLVIQVVLIMVVTFPILGFTCQGSYFLVVLLTFLQGICGMTLGKRLGYITLSCIFE